MISKYGKHAVLYIFLFIMSAVSVSCEQDFKQTHSIAGENYNELYESLTHYSGCGKNYHLKRQAVKFLLDNMGTHHTQTSEAVDSFIASIHTSDTVVHSTKLRELWNSFNKYDVQRTVEYDAQTLTANYMIDNVDGAFRAWESAPWHNEVGFSLFRQYVLPYRISTEHLPPIGWRDSLMNKYSNTLNGATDLKTAYENVYKSLYKAMLIKDFGYPYLLDAIEMQRVNKGSCLQRSVYIATVMRALGIPATVEVVDQWANYGTAGHSWVALVTSHGTYTIAEGDTVARMDNELNSAIFTRKFKVSDGFPYDTNFKKRSAKVWRMTFDRQKTFPFDNTAPEVVNETLVNQYRKDVSSIYGLRSSAVIDINTNTKHAYLCIYATGNGWTPVASATSVLGKYRFKNIGDSIVYLPVVYKKGIQTPVGEPFFIASGHVRYFPPMKRKGTIAIDRKYPLVPSHIKNWSELRCGRFEGSNDSLFLYCDTLYEIKKTPVFRNVINIHGNKNYRYVRYVSPSKNRCPITEIEIYERDVILKGTPFGHDVRNAQKCFDGDTFTPVDKPQVGYSVGLDIGEPKRISRIVYFPKNDGNFVVPGDEYELYYFDKSWCLAGSLIADDYKLVFPEVPYGSILLLRDLSKGIEERIFTYTHGKQQWW